MNRSASDVVLVLMAVIGATSTIVAQLLLRSTSPLYLISIRFLIASVVLLVLSPSLIRNVNRHAIKGGLSVASGFGFGCIFLYYALSIVNSGHASFIINLGIVIVPLYLWIFSRIKPIKNEWIALMLAVPGLCLFTYSDSGSFHWSDLLLLLSASSYAVYTISLSYFSPYCDTRQLSLISFIFISILCGFSSVILGESHAFRWTNQDWILFTYLVLVCTVVRFLGQSWAQKSTSSTHAAIIFTLEPLFTAVLSYLFIGEIFTVQKLIGGGLIFASAILVPLGNKRVV